MAKHRRLKNLLLHCCGVRDAHLLRAPVAGGGVNSQVSNAIASSADANTSQHWSSPTTNMSNQWIQTEVKRGTYGFQAGQPNPELIPIAEISRALTDAVTAGNDPLMLQCKCSIVSSEYRLGGARSSSFAQSYDVFIASVMQTERHENS